MERILPRRAKNKQGEEEKALCVFRRIILTIPCPYLPMVVSLHSVPLEESVIGCIPALFRAVYRAGPVFRSVF